VWLGFGAAHGQLRRCFFFEQKTAYEIGTGDWSSELFRSGGVGSVKKFLNSDGERAKKDAFGTSVKTYIRDFGGFETKGIIAIKNAKVKLLHFMNDKNSRSIV